MLPDGLHATHIIAGMGGLLGGLAKAPETADLCMQTYACTCVQGHKRKPERVKQVKQAKKAKPAKQRNEPAEREIEARLPDMLTELVSTQTRHQTRKPDSPPDSLYAF